MISCTIANSAKIMSSSTHKYSTEQIQVRFNGHRCPEAWQRDKRGLAAAVQRPERSNGKSCIIYKADLALIDTNIIAAG
jgi:hypothetical protein